MLRRRRRFGVGSGLVDCPQERGADGAATLAMPEIDSSLAPKGMGDLDTTVSMEKYKAVVKQLKKDKAKLEQLQQQLEYTQETFDNESADESTPVALTEESVVELQRKYKKAARKARSLTEKMATMEQQREEVGALVNELKEGYGQAVERTRETEAMRASLEAEMESLERLNEQSKLLEEKLKIAEEQAEHERVSARDALDQARLFEERVQEVENERTDLLYQVESLEEQLEAEQKFARQNYVELMILKQENEHISQGYVAISERLNSKLDELAEVEETRDVYKKQKDKALEQLSQLQELLQKQSESQQVANELLKSVEQNVKAKGARAQQRAAVTLSPGAEDAYEDDFEED